MGQSDFIIDLSTFFKEGIGLDGTEDDIDYFHGGEVYFIE